MTLFTVRADMLRIASRFALPVPLEPEPGDGPALPALCGVHIETHPNGGLYIVGDDGADMIVLRDMSGRTERSQLMSGPLNIRIPEPFLRECADLQRGYDADGERIGGKSEPLMARVDTRLVQVTRRIGNAPGPVLDARPLLCAGPYPDFRAQFPVKWGSRSGVFESISRLERLAWTSRAIARVAGVPARESGDTEFLCRYGDTGTVITWPDFEMAALLMRQPATWPSGQLADLALAGADEDETAEKAGLVA